MRILTWLPVALALAVAAPAAGQPSRGQAIALFAKANKPLTASVAAAADAGAAAAALRTASRAGLGRLSDGEVAQLLIELSDVAGGDGKYADAIRLGEHSLAITRAGRLGPGLEFDGLTRTGTFRYQLDDYDGATRDLDAARHAAAAIRPLDVNSVANATANFAVILDQSGRYREAEAALREAIALRARAAEQRPASIAVAWLALAAVHKRMGRHDLSEHDYRTGLALLEQAAQTTTATYATSLHNYGVLMGEVGRDDEAAALYVRALAILPADKRLAPENTNDHTSLAGALMALGRLDEAEAAVRDAERAAAAKSRPDRGSINVLAARSRVAARRGDVAGAERGAREAVALSRRILQPGNIILAQNLVALSATLRAAGKPAEARAAADEALVVGAAVPDRNPLRALAQDARAAALAADGRPLDALAASRVAAETQARRFAEEAGRTPVPLQPEERPVVPRRVALLWDASHQ